MHGILILSLTLLAPAPRARPPGLSRIPADSTVCVRTTRYFPEIRQWVHCLPAGRWLRMQEQARARARTEARLREQRMQRERDWERRQELARAEERQDRERAVRREDERRRSEERRRRDQGKMPR